MIRSTSTNGMKAHRAMKLQARRISSTTTIPLSPHVRAMSLRANIIVAPCPCDVAPCPFDVAPCPFDVAPSQHHCRLMSVRCRSEPTSLSPHVRAMSPHVRAMSPRANIIVASCPCDVAPCPFDVAPSQHHCRPMSVRCRPEPVSQAVPITGCPCQSSTLSSPLLAGARMLRYSTAALDTEAEKEHQLSSVMKSWNMISSQNRRYLIRTTA